MCFDSSDTPESPDYTDLIDMIRGSASSSYGLSTEMQEWARNAYAENKGVSDIVIDKALGEMDKMIADSDWSRDRYRNIFAPLEEQLAAEAESYASPERLEYEAGKAEADVAAQFEQARKTAQERLEGYGVDPSQTRQGAMDLGSRVAEAAAQASGGNQARWHAEDVGRQLRSEAINVGRGVSGDIRADSSAGLAAGNQGANTGLATTASGANTMGTGTTWTGIGDAAVSNWGNTLNQDYQNQMAQYEADQQASSGWGELAGTVVGTIAGGPIGAGIGNKVGSFFGFAEGGAIPEEEGYLPEEMSPSGGAITDDIPAEIQPGGQPARLNAGEFVIPEDVVGWLGEKGIQQLIMKARKEMTGGNGERPAQPTEGPPPGYAGAGIPEPRGAI